MTKIETSPAGAECWYNEAEDTVHMKYVEYELIYFDRIKGFEENKPYCFNKHTDSRRPGEVYDLEDDVWKELNNE